MRNRREAGVTLMELLIAVSLVALLSLGMVMAIRVGLSAMEKINAKFIANRKILSIERILESQIGGIMPVVANCAGAGGSKFLFFEGKSNSMHFVSNYSLQEGSRGYPRILSFSVVPANEGVRLIVNEEVFPGPVGAGQFCAGINAGVPVFNDAGANPKSFVIADNLAYCRILYQKINPPPQNDVWVAAWTGVELQSTGLLPSAIKIEMAPVRANPANLQIMSITAPIRVTRWAMVPYADN